MDDKEEKFDFEKVLEDFKSNSKESEKNPTLEKLKEAREKYKKDAQTGRAFLKDLIEKNKSEETLKWEALVKKYKK